MKVIAAIDWSNPLDYQNTTQEELIARIKELERLNRALLDEKEHQASLDFPWTGNLGHWYWDIPNNTVVFNPLKIEALGYAMEELPEIVPYQFFTDKLHPEDYPGVMAAMVEHLQGRAIMLELEEKIRDYQEAGYPFAVGMFDIDLFKKVNDEHGHVVGDEILQKVAELISGAIREEDSAGRFGGEEFLVLFARTSQEHAMAVAQRIREEVARHGVIGDARVTISGGVKEYQHESVAELLDAADHYLYQAKKAGRNRIAG